MNSLTFGTQIRSGLKEVQSVLMSPFKISISYNNLCREAVPEWGGLGG